MSKKNHFSSRMKSKSREELEEILSSNDYVDEAKQAAVWELEKLGVKASFISKEKTNDNPFNDFLPKTTREERAFYRRTILFFGILCILTALYYLLPELLVFKSSLIPLKGTTKSSTLCIKKVHSHSRLGNTSTSRWANLIFSLKEHDKLFRLSENIGDQYDHEDYRYISEKLNKCDKVIVWVRKSELTQNDPKVFQIDADDETILDLETVKNQNYAGFFGLMFLGFFSIALVVLREKIM